MKKLLILMALFNFFSSCSGKPSYEGRVKSFEFYYNGSIGADSHNFKVAVDGDVVTIKYEDMLLPAYDVMTDTLPAVVLDSLTQLCRKHNVQNWDGFDGVNRYVLDGWGFSLYVSFDDGRSLSAHGSNMWPDGYHAFRDDMYTVMKPYLDQVKEKYRQMKIARGIGDKLQYVWINFIQKGKSGGNRFELRLSRDSADTSVSITIDDYSGEFWQPDTHGYLSGSVPDAQFCWNEIEALAKRCEIIQWIDYDKAAEDYNNSEWFQMRVEYDQGFISAMGTEHPEHYDDFRAGLLRLLADNCERYAAQGLVTFSEK